MHLNVCIKEEIEQNKIAALASKLFVAGDENRLRILCLIFAEKKVCVTNIAEKLDMSVATASHHLKSLARAGFLEPERTGKQVCYLLVKSRFNTSLKNFICRNK